MLFLLFVILSYLHILFLLSYLLRLSLTTLDQRKGLYPDLPTAGYLGHKGRHSPELEDTLGPPDPEPLSYRGCLLHPPLPHTPPQQSPTLNPLPQSPFSPLPLPGPL